MPFANKLKKPLWVWAIAIFYFCVGAMTLLTFVHLHIVRDPGPFSPEQLSAFRAQIRAWSLFGLLPALNIAAAVTLFKMRAAAFYLFTGLLVVRICNDTILLLFFEQLAQFDSSGEKLTGLIIGYGINLAVCFYAYRLKQTGRLK